MALEGAQVGVGRSLVAGILPSGAGGNGGQFLQYQEKAPEGLELIPEAVQQTGGQFQAEESRVEESWEPPAITKRSREH